MMLVALATLPCDGSAEEVPVRIEGWSPEDAQWLEDELSRWFSLREHWLCTPREVEPTCITVAAAQSGAAVSAVIHGEARFRHVLDSSGSVELFRYQVAAAVEELARTSWAVSHERFAVLAHAQFAWMRAGLMWGGGEVGIRFAIQRTMSVEVGLAGMVSPRVSMSTGATLDSALLAGVASWRWLPLRLGIVRAGPRLLVQAGALMLRVEEQGNFRVQGVTPWLSGAVGVCVDVDIHRVTLGVVADVGNAFVGAHIDADSASIQQVRGVYGAVAAHVGFRW